ncbi:hypothetical protein FRC01_005480 [Tulasnella sp. 417]|nr:hypothetical protein FRC01_005480 [Tulasnella sp. 417]
MRLAYRGYIGCKCFYPYPERCCRHSYSNYASPPISRIPTVTIFYGIATMLDLVILRFSIRSIRKKEDDFHGPSFDAGGEKGGHEGKRGVNLRQLSELSYGQTPLRQRDVTGSSRSAAEKTYPAEQAFDPYAEAGVPYQPYRQGSSGSVNDPTTQSLLGREREGGY